jgi:integrase
MLNFAKRRGWITANPFNQGDPLISDAAEVPRNRAERAEELDKLLAACTDWRAYLRPIILIMADSALRLTEAKRLTRGEVDFERKVAYVRARNTKTNKPRITPLSDRLIEELEVWCKKATSDDAPILQQGEYRKAWEAVKKKAGVSDDLQLRDLRGWGTSRLARALAAAQLPWQYGMKATGHTQEKTYRRYLKTDEETAQQIGEALKKIEDKAA